MTTNTIRRSALGAGQFVLKTVTLALRAAGLVLLVVFKAAAAVCAFALLFDDEREEQFDPYDGGLNTQNPNPDGVMKYGYYPDGMPWPENVEDSQWGAIYGKDHPKHDRVISW